MHALLILPRLAAPVALFLALVGCPERDAPATAPLSDGAASDGSSDAAAASGDAGAVADAVTDVSVDAAIPDTSSPPDADADADAAVGNDADAGPGEVTEPVPTFSAYAAPPAASTLPPERVSCPVIRAERCVGDVREVCALFDAGAGTWAESVPPMTEQAFVFDRYYDLYHQMNGQASDVDFTQPVLAGTPESEWSRPEVFQRYDGIGDASGWTGTALWAAAARYAVTGTPADYARMVEKLEAMAFLYEVMPVRGQLARSHFAMLPEGAPLPVGHWGEAISPYRVFDGSDGHLGFPIADELLDRLPAYYTQGVEIAGQHWPTVPRVMADASRDMYVRSLPGILLALDLLGAGEREDRVRQVLTDEIACTFRRLKKGRIRNVQMNKDFLEAATAYFAGPAITLDPGDLDPTTLDELTFYVMEQPHPKHMDAFDPTCPETPPMEVDPSLDLDAADPAFLLSLVTLALREQTQGDVPIAWSMHVSVRPSDLLFVLQWALAAHYLTGDAAALDFARALLEEVPFEGVMGLWGAFRLPKYCAPHFAPSIGYPSLYNVLARVDRAQFPAFWSALAGVARTEAREKLDGQRGDPFFGILYHRMTTPEVDPGRDAFVADAVALLGTYGMNPDDKLEPDRNYPRNFVDPPDPDVPLESIAPGDPEWTLCEVPAQILGIDIPPPKIDGIPTRAVDPLPLPKRIGGTLLWQMDPWMVLREYGGTGMDTQWPMLGMFTPYWIGRADGVITEGQGLALAWRATEGACVP